jgi:hypothetical protein
MGIVSKYLPPDEAFYMKMQQLVHKIEELKALVGIYEQVAQGLAQANMVVASMDETTAEDQREAVMTKLAEIESRYTNLRKFLLERTGAEDEDAAIHKVQEHLARLSLYQDIRSQQLELRIQLDLELAMGAVDAETRQQVETKLQGMQTRLDTVVRQGADALAGPRLISLA